MESTPVSFNFEVAHVHLQSLLSFPLSIALRTIFHCSKAAYVDHVSCQPRYTIVIDSSSALYSMLCTLAVPSHQPCFRMR